MDLVLRVLVNALALAAAVWVVPGIELGGADDADRALTLLVVAVVFGLVNAFVKPLTQLLALPLYVLTLGLVAFVVNALMLLLTAWLAGLADLPFEVDGFWSALLGALVVGFVSWLVGSFVDRGRGR
ncbi:MAG TPA: phage holin family protein [Jiangellales bacterium]|nr:phage holin family protein [Jiangellales bacterium]